MILKHSTGKLHYSMINDSAQETKSDFMTLRACLITELLLPHPPQ